jgi:O-antigen/teichoic acid export membrane protein
MIAVAVVAGVAFNALPLALSTALFVSVRLVYADIEAFWIAAHLGDRTLALALAVNGVLTGAGIFVGSGMGPSVMTLVSATGNLVAVLILVASKRVRARSDPLPDIVRETRGMAGSVVLGVVYLRSDLVILGATGLPLGSVAIYGLFTRAFETVGIIRGALAQQETRDLARLDVASRMARLTAWSVQGQALVGALAGLGALAVAVVGIEVGNAIGGFELSVVLVAIVAMPLYWSHSSTTAMIFSDRRTHLLLLGSIVACLVSVLLKVALIETWGISGAVFALGVAEYISCAAFVTLYWRPRISRAALSVLLPPIVSMAVVGSMSLLIASAVL